MLEPELLRHYTWADEDQYLAWTMAVVTGRDRNDVIRAYGGDPSQESASIPFGDASVNFDELGVFSLVQVRQHGPHVLMIEKIGWLGVTAGIAERASADGGRFICVHWDLNSRVRLIEAQDGVLLADFEPTFAITSEDRTIDRGDTYPDWISDVRFDRDALGATLLAIVEWRTGVAFDLAWLQEPTPTYRIAYPRA